MNKIDFTLEDKTVLDAINKMLAVTENPTEIFEGIGDALENRTRLHFNDGEDPYGITWPAPVFRSGQPLRDTGRLMNSITHQANATGVDVGTNVCYAATQQHGAVITAKPGDAGANGCGTRKGAPYLVFKAGGHWIRTKRVNVPARPFLPDDRGLPNEWRGDILDVISREFGIGGKS